MKKLGLILPIFAFLSGSIINVSQNSANYTHWLLLALAVLLGIDFISYLFSEKIAKQLQWIQVLKEIYKNILVGGVIVISFILDGILQTGETMRHATIIFYIGYEMMIILSYAAQMGLPLPAKLEEFMKEFKK